MTIFYIRRFLMRSADLYYFMVSLHCGFFFYYDYINTYRSDVLKVFEVGRVFSILFSQISDFLKVN
jgi:ABC-type enterochelin transport system permease subunit